MADEKKAPSGKRREQTGVVVSAKVASCNGDEAVRRSIESAVLAASPLPQAPTPALYERIVNVRFQPED